ncbi:hypothetical protein [Streptomyces sp. NPDC056713]|uniref:hypothetical protein n=1 Tax=Streptomyces sp. NPDC056713 TaxID=3345921 RepID=UPI003683A6FE
MARQRVTPSDVFGTTCVAQEMEPEYTELLSSLDAVIDVEAGLREILLRSDHEQQVANLDGRLDVEAGLAAILPTAPARTSWNPSAVWSLHETERGVDDFTAVDPAIRMQLRQDDEVVHFYGSLQVADEVGAQIDEIAGVASRLVAQLMMNEREIEFSDVVEATLHLSSAVLDFTTIPNTRAEAALKEVYRLSRKLTIACNSASDAARTLATIRCTPRRSRNTPGQLSLREAQRLLATALEDARGILYPLLDRCVAANGAVLSYQQLRKMAIQRLLALRLNAPRFPYLTAPELRAFLDDFICADLRGANLVGVDMTGVRWSVQTLWPVDLDVDDLRHRSAEDPADSGIYVVRSGTARTRQLVAV